MAPRINARIHTYTKMCIHFFCTTYLLSINTSKFPITYIFVSNKFKIMSNKKLLIIENIKDFINIYKLINNCI